MSKWRCNWCYKEHELVSCDDGVLESRQIAGRMALGLYGQCDSIMCKKRDRSRFVPLDCEAKAIYPNRYHDKFKRIT